MKIYEILDRDPRSARLANDGQARIADRRDEKANAELRAELETFVCEGQFADAIQRVLERYLGNLDHTKQQSAWVSGFFGSGKSHLLKMLAHLWVNTTFADGSTARGLVGQGLPDGIRAPLVELDRQAKRTGRKPVAAAGTLLGGSVDHVRHTVLSILLRARGLPDQYPQAMFCFWLREQGWLDQVRAAVEAGGRDWLKELNNLYVSPHIARALMQADPHLAADEEKAHELLLQQFPQLVTDITTAQFIAAARKALSEDGPLPLTILVLDEVQQYINEAQDRAAAITEVAEAIQTQFDSRVMLVGAGQSALSAGTPALLWLRDRFQIAVELTDADVEAVTRKVLLRKKPSAVPAIEKTLDKHSGEVDRHLQGTKLGRRGEDQRDRVQDYPLLPTRRRFWEACFGAADAAGTHSQLRSQLRILYDSLHDIAERPLGAVIPASDLFNALAPNLVNTSFLLNEINTRIQKFDDGTADGRLRRDLCGLVFLIGKLPHEKNKDLGVRANAATLADLMVDDLTQDSGILRNRIAQILKALERDGRLMKVEDEYRLQTTEGAEWDRAYREKQSALQSNEVEIASRREHLFGSEVQKILDEVKLIHGESKLRRMLALHIGTEPPRGGGDQVTVWLLDGWSSAEKDMLASARRLGLEDPTLHVYLPKKSADELKARIIDAEAARQVLDHYGTPAGGPGREAHEGMDSRRRAAEASRDEIVREVIRSAKVIQGGGTEIFGEGLAEKIRSGARQSLARLFPRFDEADHRAWEAAVRRARDGSDEPFKVVGWEQATEEHAVAKEVLARVGAGARGSDIQKVLKASSFGWPQDAIDAALIALHRSGHLRATRNGQPIAVGSLDQASVKSAEFRLEKVRLTASERIALRGLFEKAGVTTRSGDEEARAIVFLDALGQRARQAGGDGPLPAIPDIRLIEDLGRRTGSEQLGAILESKAQLEEKIAAWGTLAKRADERRPAWEMAIAFRRHAEGLAVADEIGKELDAIAEQRSLLGDADPVTPLVAKIAAALREELKRLRGGLVHAVERANADLAVDATWKGLEDSAREQIRRAVGLEAPTAVDISTSEALRRCLDERSLSAWRALVDAVPQRVGKALEEALRLAKRDSEAKPASTVTVRRCTLADEAAVGAWVAEHEAKLREAVGKGPVVVN